LAKFMPSAPCVLRLCGTNGCTRTASPQIDLRHNFKQVPQNCSNVHEIGHPTSSMWHADQVWLLYDPTTNGCVSNRRTFLSNSERTLALFWGCRIIPVSSDRPCSTALGCRGCRWRCWPQPHIGLLRTIPAANTTKKYDIPSCLRSH
jgi:hypothetical protein